MTGSGGSSGQVYFEFTQLGGQMRVAAIDVQTGVEVVVIMPLSANRMQMQTFALAKLKKKLGGPEPEPQPPSGLSKGRIA